MESSRLQRVPLPTSLVAWFVHGRTSSRVAQDGTFCSPSPCRIRSHQVHRSATTPGVVANLSSNPQRANGRIPVISRTATRMFAKVASEAVPTLVIMVIEIQLPSPPLPDDCLFHSPSRVGGKKESLYISPKSLPPFS